MTDQTRNDTQNENDIDIDTSNTPNTSNTSSATQPGDTDSSQSEILAKIANRISAKVEQQHGDDSADAIKRSAEQMRQRLEALREEASGTSDRRDDVEAAAPEATDGAQTTEVHAEAPFASAEAALSRLTEQAKAAAPAHEEPWSGDAAEELTLLCEDAGLATGRKRDDKLIGAEPAEAADQGDASYVYLQPDPREIGQKWFEARFEELNQRLDANNPGNGDLPTVLLEKFDALEQRLDRALGPQDDDAGASSLQDIELCIAEIAGQLDQNSQQIGRIENIETQVAKLAASFTGGEAMGATGVAADAGTLAEMVAKHLESMPPGITDGSNGDTSGIAELSAAMKEFMRERRSEGEHANAVLDTMQQTILRVLDRMEALETNGLAGPRGSAPAMPAASAQQGAAPAAASQPVAPVEAGDKMAISNSPAPSPRAPQDNDSDAAESLNRLHQAVSDLDDTAPQSGIEPQRPDAPKAPAAPRRPVAAQRSPAAQSRADFIKAARQAAAKASNQTAEEPSLETGPEIEPEGEERSVFGRKVKRREMDQPTELAINDDAEGEEIDATNDGFSLSSLSTRLRPRKKKKSGSGRARLVVAALALVAISLGATKYMMSLSSDAARQQLQSNSQQQDTRQRMNEARQRVGNVRPQQGSNGNLSAASGNAHESGQPAAVDSNASGVTYDETSGRLVQTTAVHPDDRMTAQPTAPVSTTPGSVRRKGLPPAMVGPLSLRLAAANGDASAEFQVASRFADGKGVAQDFAEALKWYRRSAGRGFALAQYRLGTFYERGLGVDKDLSRARVWYERAAGQDNIKAMHNLAVLAAGSSSGKPDYATAARWFQAAAERGLGDSQFNLAILHQNGLGVTRDEAMAYKWFALAATAGDQEAERRKKELSKRIGQTRAEQLDGELNGWRRKPVDKLANDPHYAGQSWQRRQQS